MLRLGRIGSQETIMCEVCQGEFQSPYLLQMHKLCHFNTANTCYVCDKVFPGAKALLTHIVSIHRLLLPVPLQNIEDKDILHCELCMQCFASKQGLHIHREQHSYEENKYDCKICGLHFEDCHSFVVHLNRPGHHEMKLKVQNGFVCVDCRAVFGNRDGYAMHMMVRAQNEGCGAPPPVTHKTKEPTPIQITNGIEVPSDDQPTERHKLADISPRTDPGSIFTCIECHKAFGNRDSLAMHVLNHTRNDSIKDQRCNSAPLVNHLTSPLSRQSRSLPTVSNLFIPTIPLTTIQPEQQCTTDINHQNSTDSQQTKQGECDSMATEHVPLNLHRRKRKISYPLSSFRNVKGMNDSDIDDTWSDYGNNVGKANERETPQNENEQSKTINHMPIQVKQEPIDFSEQNEHRTSSNCVEELDGRSTGSVSVLNLSAQALNYQNLKEQRKADILDDPYLARLFNLHENQNSASLEVLNFLHQNSNSLYMCKFCKIVFVDRTLYHLHMGLHNLNNPWQCNLCGKVCQNSIAFTSHVIHYE